MDDLCTSCLCKGRKLFTLEPIALYEIYSQILNEIPSTVEKKECMSVCWECYAKLKNWQKFRNQAQSSYKQLLEYTQQTSSPLRPCTTLAVHPVAVFSCPEDIVKPENVLEDDIKSEVEEHCEPETFVNELKVERWSKRKGKSPKKLKKKLKANHKTKSILNEDLDSSLTIDDVECDDKYADEKVDVENHQELADNGKEEASQMNLPTLIPYSTLSIQNITKLVIDQMKTKNDCEPEVINDGTNVVKAKGKDILQKPKKKRKLVKTKTTRKRKLSNEETNEHVSSPIGDDADCDNDDVLNEPDVKGDVENHQQEFDDENVKINNKKKTKMETDKLVLPNKKMIGDKPQCLDCGKIFSSKKTFRYHWTVLHKGQNRYPCSICGKVYQWKSNLGRHLRSHKARDSGELYCELCDKRFASVATYRQHLSISRRHVSESEFSFMCNECGKKFVSKTRLRDHIDWEHLKKIKFTCKLCHKPFKCHTSLYVHMQNVHANKEKDLCHVCGKAYQNAAKLKYHIVAMHTDETPYECVHCRVSFGWYSSLYRHVREVHHKIKLQPKKSSKKSKKLDLLPSLLNHHPPLHMPGPA